MSDQYKIASLNNKDDIIRDISKYESDLKKKLGQDVVLIAYSKENRS